MNELTDNLSKALSSFNDRRVITDKELQDLRSAIVAILGANKQAVEALNAETKKQLTETLRYLETEHKSLLQAINGDLKATKSEVERLTKETNDRAFKRLQTLIKAIKMPKDGKDGVSGKDGLPGKDGSPDTAVEVRDKLETLEGDERLDAQHIKGWDRYFGKVVKKGKDMLVGGIRFFENLADVSISITKKRQDLVAQYNTTNQRWQDGIAITVSTTAPSNPQINDLWVDIN